jgi:peptidoglycan/xylan/chitin deacetylase (PgdA/CDA1 family)
MSWKSRLRKFVKSKRVVVLMYHRIDDVVIDPWNLAVSPGNFERQLIVLKNNYHIISPIELLNQLEQKSIKPNQVCITFDDGYLDNFTQARPLLEKYQIPATFFIASHFLKEQQSFWWDELQALILEPQKLPARFSLTINGQLLAFNLENNGYLAKEQELRQVPRDILKSEISNRHAIYLKIWEQLRKLPLEKIQFTITELSSILGLNASITAPPPMTLLQLKELSLNPLFTIGLHTHQHLSLSYHSRKVQKADLEQNKKLLQETCSVAVDTLSYPHGLFNEETLSIVEELKVKAAFTTQPVSIGKTANKHQIGRFQAFNWNEDEFRSQLKSMFYK